ncbi:MAG TPA: carbohydrate kinase [Pedobacter sp.]|jgi:fructokinase
MNHVVCFGEILWDNFTSGRRPGGAPLNVALHLHKQGKQVELISSIGNDEAGKDLKVYLEDNGLAADHIQLHQDLPTGIVEVMLDNDQQATYNIVQPVAWDEITYQENYDSLISNANLLVFGSLACRSDVSYTTLLNLLEGAKLSVFDMNLRPPHFTSERLKYLISRCDILKINEHELAWLDLEYELNSKDTVSSLHRLSEITGIQTICLTLGDKGAIISYEGNIYKHPCFPVKVADTVGAGDAFLAAFLSGYLEKKPMDKVLELACATGAFVASRSGANPKYTLADIYNSTVFNLTKD